MMTAGGGQLPAWLGFASLVPTTIVALWKRQVSSAGFATAVALVYVTFFALSKQAFVNYYIFVFGALAIALAHADSQPRTIAGSS
jgi:hypothetical protein